MPHLQGLNGGVAVVEGVGPQAGRGHRHRAVGEGGGGDGGERICYPIPIVAVEITRHHGGVCGAVIHPARFDGVSRNGAADDGCIIAATDAEAGRVLVGARGVAAFTHLQHKAIGYALGLGQRLGIGVGVVEVVNKFSGVHRQQGRAIGAGFLVGGT